MTHSFTYIDIGGNQAQYAVSDEDQRRDFHWSTDHGDRGVARTFDLAQCQARTVLKDSMAAHRRSEEVLRADSYTSRWRPREGPRGTPPGTDPPVHAAQKARLGT